MVASIVGTLGLKIKSVQIQDDIWGGYGRMTIHAWKFVHTPCLLEPLVYKGFLYLGQMVYSHSVYM